MHCHEVSNSLGKAKAFMNCNHQLMDCNAANLHKFCSAKQLQTLVVPTNSLFCRSQQVICIQRIKFSFLTFPQLSVYLLRKELVINTSSSKVAIFLCFSKGFLVGTSSDFNLSSTMSHTYLRLSK